MMSGKQLLTFWMIIISLSSGSNSIKQVIVIGYVRFQVLMAVKFPDCTAPHTVSLISGLHASKTQLNCQILLQLTKIFISYQRIPWEFSQLIRHACILMCHSDCCSSPYVLIPSTSTFFYKEVKWPGKRIIFNCLWSTIKLPVRNKSTTFGATVSIINYPAWSKFY